jgi:hypothetical protein
VPRHEHGALAALQVACTRDKRKCDPCAPRLLQTRFAALAHGVYTRAECAALPARPEAAGFSPAAVGVAGGVQRVLQGVRTGDRAMLDDPAFAADMWGRVRDFAPRAWTFAGEARPCAAVGVNERLRVLRYGAGHKFNPHVDGVYTCPRTGDRSAVTALLSLNDGGDGGEFAGGRTAFAAPAARCCCSTTRCATRASRSRPAASACCAPRCSFARCSFARRRAGCPSVDFERIRRPDNDARR